MMKILIILMFLTSFGCHQQEKSLNIVKTKPLENKETIFWIDTISNGKFLKIYSPKNDWQTLSAEYGNKTTKHKVNLSGEKYQILRIPFSNEIKWITEKSISLIGGCGSGCRYVIIFNMDNEEPSIEEIEYYPKNKSNDFETDNLNLYITTNQNHENSPSFVVVDTDNQKRDTILLPKHWTRGLGTISNIVDKIKIKNSKINVYQNQENGKIKKQSKTILLK